MYDINYKTPKISYFFLFLSQNPNSFSLSLSLSLSLSHPIFIYDLKIKKQLKVLEINKANILNIKDLNTF